jgi:hypothetical protein
MQRQKEDSSVVVFQAKSGAIEQRADTSAETIWASQAEIAKIFNVGPQAITKHIGNIYAEGELVKPATCSKMEQVRNEGGRTVRRLIEVYNLDVI